MQFDLSGIKTPKSLHGDYLWPNELSTFTDKKTGSKVLLIPDGFLMPGQSDGGMNSSKYFSIITFQFSKYFQFYNENYFYLKYIFLQVFLRLKTLKREAARTPSLCASPATRKGV
jgi:hypothetical protein